MPQNAALCGYGLKVTLSPHPPRSVGSIEDLRTGGRWFKPLAQPIFFPRIEDRHSKRINSSLSNVHS